MAITAESFEFRRERGRNTLRDSNRAEAIFASTQATRDRSIHQLVTHRNSLRSYLARRFATGTIPGKRRCRPKSNGTATFNGLTSAGQIPHFPESGIRIGSTPKALTPK